LPRRIAAFVQPHYDVAMSFSDTVFLFFLALILFGPKKLPEMARQAGKLLAELRRASNEFRSQIETEIAHLEVEKSQTVLPPSPPPEGTVASVNTNPAAGEPSPLELPDPPVAPAAESAALATISDHSDTVTSSSSTPQLEPAVKPAISTSQEPHV
jgi:Sec-independent protein translocase protein TatA